MRRYGVHEQVVGKYENIYRFKDVTDMTQIKATQHLLKHRASEYPDRKMAFFYAFAGHGIQCDGQQFVVVNQFVKGFYYLWNTEARIRKMAKDFPNTYSLAVYACCREIYSLKNHSGFIGGPKEKAKAYYTEFLTHKF